MNITEPFYFFFYLDRRRDFEKNGRKFLQVFFEPDFLLKHANHVENNQIEKVYHLKCKTVNLTNDQVGYHSNVQDFTSENASFVSSLLLWIKFCFSAISSRKKVRKFSRPRPGIFVFCPCNVFPRISNPLKGIAVQLHAQLMFNNNSSKENFLLSRSCQAQASSVMKKINSHQRNRDSLP